MLQPLVRRTWAPRGETPIHRSWGRHDRLSVITALTVSPRRRRLGLYFEVLDHNLHTEDAEAFVHQLRRQLGRKLLLVWDRLNVHRSAAKSFDEESIVVEWLPPYAPDINPVEDVWNYSKRAHLANYLPKDVLDLNCAVAVSLGLLKRQQALLHSFFRHAQLLL